MASASIAELLVRLCFLSIIFLITWLIGSQAKRLGSSGVIGMALAGYGALILVNPYWYIPVLICTILVSNLNLFLEMPGNQDELVRVRPIFYMFIGSLFWMIAASMALESEKLLFVPYLVSFAAVLSIRWKWYQREGNLISGRRKKFLPDWIANGNFLIRAFFLSLAFLLPNLVLQNELHPFFSLFTSVLGILISDYIYWVLGKRFHGKWSKIAFLRMALFSTMAASVVVFAINYWFYH
jgi:hypothetical protein